MLKSLDEDFTSDTQKDAAEFIDKLFQFMDEDYVNMTNIIHGGSCTDIVSPFAKDYEFQIHEV